MMTALNISSAAIWLDSVKPGWADKINVSDLDMAVGSKCILGQIYSDDAIGNNGYAFAYNRYGGEVSYTGRFYYEFCSVASTDRWIAEIGRRKSVENNEPTVPVSKIREILESQDTTFHQINEIITVLDEIDPQQVTVTFTVNKTDLDNWLSRDDYYYSKDSRVIREAIREAL